MPEHAAFVDGDFFTPGWHYECLCGWCSVAWPTQGEALHEYLAHILAQHGAG